MNSPEEPRTARTPRLLIMWTNPQQRVWVEMIELIIINIYIELEDIRMNIPRRRRGLRNPKAFQSLRASQTLCLLTSVTC